MASGVSVESDAIKCGIACCQTSIHELESASRGLYRSYEQANSEGWNDQKYAALGGIVEKCCSALTEPISELRDCMGKLDDLLAAVGDYEKVNL